MSKIQTLSSEFCKKTSFLVPFVIAQLFFGSLVARSKCPNVGTRLTAQQYCAKYGEEARRQMKLYGVPASITLAQGMVESAYGSSYLANVANNHFGIKAHSDWRGDVVRCDDDHEDDKFCKFSSVQAGFEYHSTFLRNNSRYGKLFKLNIRDYEGWAKGLKECGYATNPRYASMLISTIEQYNLDAYDVSNGKVISITRPLYSIAYNRSAMYYIKCEQGDDLAAIAKEFGISERKLRKWNDLSKYATLKEGDPIYLQDKHKKAPKGYNNYVVKAGDSMWSISQEYRVHVSSLMKRNKLVSATVHEGQVLRLR